MILTMRVYSTPALRGLEHLEARSFTLSSRHIEIVAFKDLDIVLWYVQSYQPTASSLWSHDALQLKPSLTVLPILGRQHRLCCIDDAAVISKSRCRFILAYEQ